jgi:hypothetical protein
MTGGLTGFFGRRPLERGVAGKMGKKAKNLPFAKIYQ